MRNPNGYGTVARLTGNRRRPFIVKKVARWKDNGQPVYSVIGYAESREAGNMLLAEYNRDPWDVDRFGADREPDVDDRGFYRRECL